MTSTASPPTERLPVLYLSHGAPPLADDERWTGELAAWSADLPRPRTILIVSAHWEQAPLAVSATREARPLVYDFWGFPEKYYQVTYDAPAAPELADRLEGLMSSADVPLHRDERRGLDHGAYVPLVEMFPDADVPVLQMSMPSLDPGSLYEVGRRLAPLRDEGTLIIGSGFTTHNLRWFDPDPDSVPPSASQEFDHWSAEAIGGGDLDAVFDWDYRAPAARQAHPRSEHWAPVFVALGAAAPDGGTPQARSVIDGFWHGLSKRSWQLA